MCAHVIYKAISAIRGAGFSQMQWSAWVRPALHLSDGPVGVPDVGSSISPAQTGPLPKRAVTRAVNTGLLRSPLTT